jgi:hypothetical protein
VVFRVVISDLEGESKNGLLSASPSVFLILFAAHAGFRRPGDQMEGKITKALALATALALSPIVKTPYEDLDRL